jgi:hypothetical protein
VEIQSPPKIDLQNQIPLVRIVRSMRGSKGWSRSRVPMEENHIGVEWSRGGHGGEHGWGKKEEDE